MSVTSGVTLRLAMSSRTRRLNSLPSSDVRTRLRPSRVNSPPPYAIFAWGSVSAVTSAGRDVDEKQVALVDGDVLLDQQLRVVRRPVRREKAAAGDLEYQSGRLRLERIHHVDVAVGAVALGRGKGHAIAGAAPADSTILRPAAVGEQGDCAVGEVVAVDLRELIAACVAAEQEVFATGRLIGGAANRLVKEGQLRTRAARHRHAVHLRRVAEARCNQQLTARRVPVRETGGARLGISLHFGRQRRRHLRDALDDEGRAGRDRLCRLRRC